MLKISDNRRFLPHTDGTPFFYLGDTAWELLHRCTLEESERYLRTAQPSASPLSRRSCLPR